jgi:hypothetical protein
MEQGGVASSIFNDPIFDDLVVDDCLVGHLSGICR